VLEFLNSPRSRRAKQLLWTSAAAVLILGLWAFWWEPSSLRIVHRTIGVRPWHPEHSGLKVGVIADLHVGTPFRNLPNLKEIVTVTNAEKPDLVLLLGDFVIQGVVGGDFVIPDRIADELAGLRAPLGVVAVLGNHDWWYDGEQVRHALQSHGIQVLEDENLPLTYKGRTFWLCGLADLWTRGERVAPTLAKIEDGEPVVVLMHNPDVFPRIPEHVSLSLAGHTHGGQVDLPIVGRPIVPSRFGQRYAYGLVEESGRKLFVTSGIGTSILPVRFRVPPEIVILTLVSEGDH
jgi:predicted MPP superfamily phosphohydrolase